MSKTEKIHVARDESDAGKIVRSVCGKRMWRSELILLSNAGLLLHKTEMCGMCKKAILKKLKQELKEKKA